MAFSTGLSIASHILGDADQDIASVLLANGSLIAEIAANVRVNRSASLRLSRRVNELVVAVAYTIEHRQPNSLQDEWYHCIARFRSVVEEAQTALTKLKRGTSFYQILHQRRDAEVLRSIRDKIESAFDTLMIQSYLELHTLSDNALASSRHCTALDALDAQAAALSALDACPSFQYRAPPALPAAPSPFLGREDETAKIVGALSTGVGGNVAILGGPGIGKTSVAVAVLHEPTVVSHFREHRYFVSCDIIDEDGDLLCAIAAGTGLPAVSSRAAAIQLSRTFGGHRWLLVLDGFETVWEDSLWRTKAEEVLCFLGGIGELSLIITARGTERPQGVLWAHPTLSPLAPLSDASAKQLFAAFVDVKGNELQVAALCRAVDNVPLAIILLAYQAQYEPVAALLVQWQIAKTSMLTRGDGVQKSNSLDASIALSLRSPRIQAVPHAMTILSLLAVLPHGTTRSDFAAWTSHLPDSERALSAVLQSALAYRACDDRIGLLGPIRDYVSSQAPPSYEVVRPLYAHYLGLTHVDDAALESVSRELGNLECIIRRVLRDGLEIRAAVETASSLLELFCTTTVGVDALAMALPMLEQQHHDDLVGCAHYMLGGVLLVQGARLDAIAHLQAALPLLDAADLSDQKIACWRILASAHILGGEEQAAAYATAMVSECVRTHDTVWVRGKIEALRVNASLLLLHRDFDGARAALRAALRLGEHDERGYLRGWAGYIKAYVLYELGDVEREAGQFSAARNSFITSALLYRQGQKRTVTAVALLQLAHVVEEDVADSLLSAVMLPLHRFAYKLHLCTALVLWAEIALRRGKRGIALHRISNAIHLHESLDFPQYQQKAVSLLYVILEA